MSKWMILTRGAPGAGKTTFLRELGLVHYVVSPDQIRCEIGGLHDVGGVQERGFFQETEVWAQVREEIVDRMQRAMPVIVDATFQRVRDFEMPLRLAKKYRYSTQVIDFTMVPEETAQQRNAERNGWQRVPSKVISKAYQNFRREPMPKNTNLMPHLQFAKTPLYRELRTLVQH